MSMRETNGEEPSKAELPRSLQKGRTVYGNDREALQKAIIASGVDGGVLGVEREVLGSLPANFLLRYELLWLAAFGNAVGGRAGGVVEENVVSGAVRVVRTSTGQTETRGGAKAGKKLQGASTKGVVSNEQALSMKRKVDGVLRKVSREMRDFLGGRVDGPKGRRCSSCKRFGDDEWVYCPWDRAPMEERD